MQGDNAIITFEETKVFEIENTSFLSVVKLYKTSDWGWVLDTNLYKKKPTTSKYILLIFIFYLSQFREHLHRLKHAKSLQKVKHNIVSTCNYPYCDAL